ncbi:MAG: methylated-DNA--[protein]-cysteine S-methyltransferase [Ruminococcaceae bacterium]|nr:methylated-DNA--[protein]-cysteine S-methyltransferase [Oscillospiraceae bacterium]
MTKIGLVLEGGGMRGIYTAGVLDVFMKYGLTFDGIIGVSAGVIHGCSFLSGQRGRSIRYYKKYCSDPRFMSVRSLLTTGNMVGVDFCYHELPDKLDVFDHDTFFKNIENTAFYATCTNVETGRPEYIRITDMKKQIDYVRASASLPFISKIVNIDGKKYLDGSCTDAIPVSAFRKMGYEKNVLILTRPADYVKKQKSKYTAGIIYSKYPEFARALRVQHRRYNRTMGKIAELEKQGSVFVIRPSKPLEIERLESNPEVIGRVYNIGKADGEKYVKRLIKWLAFQKKEEQELTLDQKVYMYVAKIPKGKVVTYGQIAEHLGDKQLARTVGSILHRNPDPDKIPCYKVVNAKGQLADKFAFGGIERQKKKLIAEGIEVENYTVDLKKYQWKE